MNIPNWLNLLLFSVFLSFSVQAQYFTDLGNNNYSLGLPSDQFKDVYANQRKSNWCWAACVQMVMNYQGIKIEQEEIVMKTFGSLVDQPAYVPDMIKAITGWAPSVDGHKNFIFCDNLNSLSFKELYESLNRGKPFIVGLRNLSDGVGHAYVLTAVTFKMKGVERVPDKVILRNPWPFMTPSVNKELSKEEWTWEAFQNRLMPSYVFRIYTM